MLTFLLAVAIAAGDARGEQEIAWQVPAQSARAAQHQPFEATALTWSADRPVEIRVRASYDGVDWTDWQTAPIDDDVSDPTSGRYASSIVHFAGEYRYLDYATSSPVDSLQLTFFVAPPAQPFDGGSGAAFQLGGVTVRSRSDWGCPDGQGSRWTPAYTTVTHAIVHHTAGSNSVADWANEVRNIWSFHTISNGWGDIGYNFLIDPNGVIYEGRAGGLGAIGAHFSCRNTNTVGVSMLGTYTNTPPSEAAMKSLNALLLELTRKRGLMPSEIALHAPSNLQMPRVSSHRDGNSSPLTCTRTECPGNALYAKLPEIRAAIECVPLIEVQPASVSVASGNSASLSVVASGSGSFSYQWYAGASGDTSSPIAGATAPRLTAQPGTYWVRATNECGTIDSVAATIGSLPRRRPR